MKTRYNSAWVATVCLALTMAQGAFVSARAKDANENRGQLSASDYEFARKAACGGTMEVTLGKIAAQRSSNPQVQQFGNRMVTDHGKADQNLKQITDSKGATLPTETTKKEQKEIDKLNKLSGTEFDQEYASMMVRDHKADIKEFKKASEDATDPDLKAFAANTLPTLQEHLKLAEDMKDSTRHEVTRNR